MEESRSPASQADEEIAAVLRYSFEYNYQTPKTFSSSFEYSVDAPADAATTLLWI